MKISGPCGRLLCCLSYENSFYSEQQKLVPQTGARVTYENELWKVTEVNLVSGQLKLGAEDGRLVTIAASRCEKVDNRRRIRE
jgi:cell fate regulator YaaT (PSP1 superfamily)